MHSVRGQKERARFGTDLCTLYSGRCIGELSVIKHEERAASVISDDNISLIKIQRDIYEVRQLTLYGMESYGVIISGVQWSKYYFERELGPKAEIRVFQSHVDFPGGSFLPIESRNNANLPT